MNIRVNVDPDMLADAIKKHLGELREKLVDQVYAKCPPGMAVGDYRFELGEGTSIIVNAEYITPEEHAARVDQTIRDSNEYFTGVGKPLSDDAADRLAVKVRETLAQIKAMRLTDEADEVQG